MRYYKLFIFCTLLLLSVSCSKFVSVEESRNTADYHGYGGTKDTFTSEINTNPYSLQNMQAASDSLNNVLGLPAQRLVPTDLYVRFTLQDSTELRMLESRGYELFAYPLDDDYMPDYTPTDTLGYVYCTVPWSDTYNDVSYEVIDTCYIPDITPVQNDAFRALNSGASYNEMLEKLAYDISGNGSGSLSGIAPQSFTNRYGPYGEMRVEEATLQESTLKNMKVVAHSFVRVLTTYTDANGHFEFPRNFINPPKVRIKSEHLNGTKVYNSNIYVGCLPSEYVLPGDYSDEASYVLRTNIPINTSFQLYNCYTDYLSHCQANSIPTPPNNLSIAIIHSTNYSGGTPMLKHLNILQSESEEVLTFLQAFGFDFRIGVLYLLFKTITPDVVITDSNGVLSAKKSLFHELTHASHFTCVDSSRWWSYIATIVSNWRRSHRADVYGDGSECSDAQYFLELSESFAYALSDFKFSIFSRGNKWFSGLSNTIYYLLSNHITSLSEIFTAISNCEKNADEFCASLCQLCPEKAPRIMKAFSDHNSLINETRWKIVNNTSSTVNVRLTFGNTTSSYYMLPNQNCIFSLAPGTCAFNDIKMLYPSLYPNAVEFYADGSLVFSQYNGFPDVRLQRPFFYYHEWNESVESTTFRGRTVNYYTYTLREGDF